MTTTFNRPAPIALENFDGIYCDAFVCHQQLVFVSLWGYASRMLALYGAITSGMQQSLQLAGEHYGVNKSLEKMQCRLPKDSRYGAEMVHAMLHADIVNDGIGQQRVLLGDVSDNRLWAELGQLSELGLLPHWQDTLLPVLRTENFIRPLQAMGIEAVLLDLSHQGEYERLLCRMIRDGRLHAEPVKSENAGNTGREAA
jgi:hypothetical protein